MTLLKKPSRRDTRQKRRFMRCRCLQMIVTMNFIYNRWLLRLFFSRFPVSACTSAVILYPERGRLLSSSARAAEISSWCNKTIHDVIKKNLIPKFKIFTERKKTKPFSKGDHWNWEWNELLKARKLLSVVRLTCNTNERVSSKFGVMSLDDPFFVVRDEVKKALVNSQVSETRRTNLIVAQILSTWPDTRPTPVPYGRPGADRHVC